MRVSVVSHTYVVPANRGKIAALRDRCGVQCQLIVPDRWTDCLTDVSIGQGESSQEVAAVPARFVGHGARYWMSKGRIRDAVERFGPDVIHVEEEPYSWVAVTCASVASRLGIPMTLFTWDNLERRRLPPLESVRRWVHSRIAHAVAGNTDVAYLLKERGYRGPITILPQLGVDVPSQVSRRDRDGGLCVGYVGRLVPEKGIPTVLQAMQGLDRVKLRIVGPGPDEVRLRGLAADLGVSSRVTFVGHVPHDRVIDEISKLDALVLPTLTTSHCKEQFGHVLVEAMACGVPVLGSTCGAIPEVIGDAGFLFGEGRADELNVILRRLLDTPSLLASVGEAGRRRVLSEYTDEVLARRTCAVWESVLEARRSAASR